MTACTWDSGFKGADVVLSGGNLIARVPANEQWVRATLGRDPAAGSTPRQWEIAVPLADFSQYIRPLFGMADQDKAYSNQTAGYNNVNAWSFGFGSAGFENDFYFHASTVSSNWSGGSHGGQAHTMGFVWFPLTGNIKVYMDGVFLATVTGVTSGPGKLMYPTFGSGSSGGVGTNYDQGTANFGATTFAYPDPGSDGAISWEASSVSNTNAFFAML